jgi:hypothetical protein
MKKLCNYSKISFLTLKKIYFNIFKRENKNNNETLDTEHINFQIPSQTVTNNNNNDENPNLKKNVQSQQPKHVRNTNPTPIYNNTNYTNRNSDCCDPLTCYLCVDCSSDFLSCCK